MKKTIAILLFVLPFMAMKVTAQTQVRTGTVETINPDGTGILKDSETGN